MRAKFGAVVTSGSGKLGGNVFQGTGSGHVMRVQPGTAGRRSSKQVDAVFGALPEQGRRIFAKLISVRDISGFAGIPVEATVIFTF